MNNHFVRWNDLHRDFAIIFPQTIRDVLDNNQVATVLYSGNRFEIRPRPDGQDFDVYGPAFLEAA